MKTLLTLSLCLFLSVGCVSQAQRSAGLPDIRSHLPASLPVQGHDFEPAIKDGQRVTVEAVPYDDLKAGDYVVFWPKWSETPQVGQVHRYAPFQGWETLLTVRPLQWYLTEADYIGRVRS